MNSRIISYTSILLAVLTLAWILTLIPQMKIYGGAIDNFEEAYQYVSQPGYLFYFTYLNVVLLTIVDVVLFGLLYLFFKETYPVSSFIGILFIPVYASYNLFVYISQISIVQKFLEVYQDFLNREVTEVFLGQMIQMYEHSSIAFLNNYAYAILGIPSVLFGWMIFRMGGISMIESQRGKIQGQHGKIQGQNGKFTGLTGRFTGILLILNALACFTGMVGIISGNRLLSSGSAAGGGLFLLSLIGMAILFWKKQELDYVKAI